MRLSLIVPCFNEQDNIFPFARAVAEVFPDPSDYEIVFVNDGSKDKTLQNLKELHRQSQQNIRVVSFSRNFGKESAIYAGLQHCDGEYISLIDADLQQDPAIVKQMTEILDAEPDTDCVCAFQALLLRDAAFTAAAHPAKRRKSPVFADDTSKMSKTLLTQVHK